MATPSLPDTAANTDPAPVSRVHDPDPASCDSGPISKPSALGQTVGDVMLRTPKTLSARATLDEARAFFANPKVVTAVLVDGTAFAGLLDRTDLPSLLAGSVPIRTFARRAVPTVTAETPVSEASVILDSRGTSRLVVLDADGSTVAGLLCLDRQRTGFCS